MLVSIVPLVTFTRVLLLGRSSEIAWRRGKTAYFVGGTGTVYFGRVIQSGRVPNANEVSIGSGYHDVRRGNALFCDWTHDQQLLYLTSDPTASWDPLHDPPAKLQQFKTLVLADRQTFAFSLGWWLLILWFLPVVYFAIHWRRRMLFRRAMAKSICHQCGYDLRSSPDRCPECGTPVPDPSAR